MSRRAILISLLFICGCSRTGSAIPPVPEEISGGWRRTSLEEVPVDSAPELARRAGLRKWWRAGYGGPGVARLQIFELKSGPAGLDLVQKWRPAPDTVTFYTDRYFAVVQWERAERETLKSLVRELQKALA